MAPLERRMLDALKRGRDENGFVGVKAEFEAEGTRREELLRLHDLTRRAGLELIVKIGGCEAVSDLIDCRSYGAEQIVAPMIETAYALSKFIAAKQRTHADDDGCRFLFNVETETALKNLPKMLALGATQINGIVFGRVDFTQSCGLDSEAVNGREVTEAILEVARNCAAHDLELVVGGSVSPQSQAALTAIRRVRLDRFETRKIVFDGAVAESRGYADAIHAAIAFELAWLQNKRDHYQRASQEDASRIAMLEARAGAAAPPPGHFGAPSQ